MMVWIAHEKAIPFAVALALMALLLVMELITLAFGSALSSIVDGALPELAAGVEIVADVDLGTGGQLPLPTLLSWLKLN